jgi:tetratricopeptide (TPR) repeat protein
MVALLAPSRFEEGETPAPWPPAHVRDHVERAEQLFASGMLEEALAEDRKACRLAPNDAYLNNNLGATLAKLGRKVEALEQFQRAVDLEPKDPTMRRNLAYALWELEQRRDAIGVLTQLDHPLTKEAARVLSDLHLRGLAKKGVISWSGGKPRGSSLGIELNPGPRLSQWIIDSRR